MVTIAVSDVVVPAKPMPELDRNGELRKLLGERGEPSELVHFPHGVPQRRVEQMYASEARLVATTAGNALVAAAHDAFYGHYPLRLTPDAMWFTLAQGLAAHVAANAEALRARFVRHAGKVKLIVQRADFALGRSNPWPEAFAAFSDQIAAHVGKLRDLVVCEFSTTGAIERAASEVLLMDTFQPYFEYEMMIGCGIPAIILDGSVEDWRSVRRRAAMLSELGLEHWTRALLPILDEIVRSAEGHADRAFWRSFFRYESGSGGSELTGWILALFPYLEGGVANPYVATWEDGYRRAERRGSFRFGNEECPLPAAMPKSLASAPVRVIDVRDGSTYDLRFVAGMFGVVQDSSTRALAPEFGWAIVHE